MGKLSRLFLLFPLAASLGAAQSTTAPAESGNFDVSIHGTPVGTSNFNVRATSSGYDSTSLVRVSMQGLSYTLSKTEQLDSANRLVQVLLSGTVNGSAVRITGKPGAGPNSSQVELSISSSGRTTTSQLAAHANTVVLPDFDAGALETLLVIAAQQNNRDLWAILPKQQGSVVPVRLATYADQRGTLDGKPIAVHHLEATIAGAKTDLFSGPENQLLQAELRDQGFALVRKGFVLTPPAKPGAPPPQPQQQPGQQQAPQTQLPPQPIQQ